MPLLKLQNKLRRRKKSKPRSPSALNCAGKGMTRTWNSSTVSPKAKIWRRVTIRASVISDAVAIWTEGAVSKSHPMRKATCSEITVLFEPVSKANPSHSTLLGPAMRAGTRTKVALGSKRTKDTQHHFPTFWDNRTFIPTHQFSCFALFPQVEDYLMKCLSVSCVEEQYAFNGQTVFVMLRHLNEQPFVLKALPNFINRFWLLLIHDFSPRQGIVVSDFRHGMPQSVGANEMQPKFLIRSKNFALSRRDDAWVVSSLFC